jgi:hypothetical protein
LGATVSELTVSSSLLFAAYFSWRFALSEGQGRPDKRHANIDTDQTAAFLAVYRPDASKLIFLKS